MREMYEPAGPSTILPEESKLPLAMCRREFPDDLPSMVIEVNRTFDRRPSACTEMVLKGDR